MQKAPGPNRLPSIFYKEYWPIIGELVVKVIQHFFLSGELLKEVNKNLIVLIPKSQSPTSFNHYKPISLCNIIYKTNAKLIVLRLGPLLPKLISPNQSAFVPERWIAENEVVVQEMLHTFKKSKSKAWMMAIKLDL